MVRTEGLQVAVDEDFDIMQEYVEKWYVQKFIGPNSGLPAAGPSRSEFEPRRRLGEEAATSKHDLALRDAVRQSVQWRRKHIWGVEYLG